MTIEDVLETDHFILNSQPQAPSQTIPPIPKKFISGISVTRKPPVPLMSLLTAPPEPQIDFGIRNEPDTQDLSINFEIPVLNTAQSAVLNRPSTVDPSTSAQADS